jgi:hypothetical protein
MQTAKQEMSDLLKRLPDDCTLEDVQYHEKISIELHRRKTNCYNDLLAFCIVRYFLSITALSICSAAILLQ